MANYRKERNIIIINLDNINGEYRLDINTGIYYGIKGNPIQTCPNKKEVRHLFYENSRRDGSNLANVIKQMMDNCNKTATFKNFIKAMQGADKVDALGIRNLQLFYDEYFYLSENIKWLSAWLKQNNADIFCYNAFQTWCEFEKIRPSLGAIANQITAPMYMELKNHINNLTVEELGVCFHYLGKGKYWEYHNHSVNHLTHYIEICRVLGKQPQKTNNFMREYVETEEYYRLRKTEFDNKRMALNYEKHAKAWEFEYGDFVVSIPTCGQDIVTEGQRMHHCVGSYVDRVVNGSTYICFVRHKDTPDNCYITCQVYENGKIGQYFLAYDQYISSAEDKEFKVAFQAHLDEVWG